VRKISISFLAFFLLLSASCASRFKLSRSELHHSGGWTSFRGDRGNTGYVPQPMATPNRLLWSLKTARPLKSSPVIAGGTLFIGSLGKKILFVDALSGERLGSRKVSNPVSSSSCVGESLLYFAQDKGDDTFFCLNLLTGHLLWKTRLGDVHSSPQIYHEKVFIGSSSGSLRAFNRFNGEKIWQFETEDAISSTPACDGSPGLTTSGRMVYFGSGDDYLYALDQQKGELVWKFKAEGSIYSSPAVKVENPANGVDDKLFFGSVDGHLYALRIEDGSLIWRFETGADIYSSPAVAESLVYIGSNDYSMYAVDLSTGKLRWKFETGGAVRSSPIAVGDKLFFGSYDGNFYVLNRFSGKLLWKYQTEGMISSSPAHYDGRVYIASEDGHIYCFGF
jgi:outer membrane protein assembly factor BamB